MLIKAPASLSHKTRLLRAFWLRLSIFLSRFRGGIHPDARMIKKRLGNVESQKRRGVEEEYKYKEERVYEEYDRSIQVSHRLLLGLMTYFDRFLQFINFEFRYRIGLYNCSNVLTFYSALF